MQVGTNLSRERVTAEAEYFLGEAVVAISTATSWHALRAVGIGDKLECLGTLSSQHSRLCRRGDKFDVLGLRK